MQLSVKALAVTSGLLWGGCMLFGGLLHLASPPYAGSFLQVMASIYPGLHDSGTVVNVLVGTGYGLVDEAVAGILFAWLYNRLSGAR